MLFFPNSNHFSTELFHCIFGWYYMHTILENLKIAVFMPSFIDSNLKRKSHGWPSPHSDVKAEAEARLAELSLAES